MYTCENLKWGVAHYKASYVYRLLMSMLAIFAQTSAALLAVDIRQFDSLTCPLQPRIVCTFDWC